MIEPEPRPHASELVRTLAALADSAASRRAACPLVLGLCGAQGSGKSTAAAAAARVLERQGRRVAVLSLDDLYLPRSKRENLAAHHPLLRLRGVPGTHDVELGVAVLRALGETGRVRLPRFDKSIDDLRPRAEWPEVASPVDVVLFEGWCVGARPQAAADLARPVNALEREEDPDGRWRAFANARLAGDYQGLFARIDVLALLAAPGFSVVAGWRREQEASLRREIAGRGGVLEATMSDAQIKRFVQTYERLTEHILAEMPGRAELVVRLDSARGVTAMEWAGRGPGPHPA